MQYVYVAGGSTNAAMDKAITRQTQLALYSLINGLKQKDFGLQTIEKVTCDIREFSTRFITPADGKIVTDSGGYSFIKGDIPPSKIFMLIDCYMVYLESEISKYDYIFSLDIPFSLKFESFNTKNNILNANKKSMTEARSIITKYNDLQNKFYFVWHFKMYEQFLIWENIYKKLELNRFIKNHAIGGMVGLKKATHIKFSPFIGISYYILNKHLQSPFAEKDFRIHFLGIYSPSDRFYISFLEKLFRSYLKNISDIQTSYDSINPIHTVRMNSNVPLYTINDGEFKIYPSLLDAPKSILEIVFQNKNYCKEIMTEINRRCNGKLLKNSAAFSPLNVYSNLQLDIFFGIIIDRYNIIYEFKKSTSPTNLNGRITRIFKDIDGHYPGAFSDYIKKTIVTSLERAWFWHRWFVDRRDEATLESYMAHEIQDIGFPYRLR